MRICQQCSGLAGYRPVIRLLRPGNTPRVPIIPPNAHLTNHLFQTIVSQWTLACIPRFCTAMVSFSDLETDRIRRVRLCHVFPSVRHSFITTFDKRSLMAGSKTFFLARSTRRGKRRWTNDWSGGVGILEWITPLMTDGGTHTESI